MKDWIGLGVQQPRRVLATMLLLSVLMAAGLFDFSSDGLSLRLDATVQPLLARNDPALAVFAYSQAQFGSDEMVIVALRGAQPVLHPQTLEVLEQLHRELAAIPGVRQVSSLHNAALAREIDGGTEVWSVPVWLQRFALPPDELTRDLIAHPIFGRNLISEDGLVAGLILSLNARGSGDALHDGVTQQILQTADRIAAQHPAQAAQIWVGGPGVVAAASVDAIARSYQRMLPALLLVMGGLLAYAFRSRRAVAVPFMIILLSELWTLGLMGWLGHELNMITVIVPPLVMTLGLAYSTHFFATYYEFAPRFAQQPQVLVALSLRRIAFPMLLTGITTICGFAGLMISPLPAIRQFGLYSAFGVAASVVLALSAGPAVLSLLPGPRRIRQPKALEKIFAVLSHLLMRYRLSILFLGGLTAVLALLAASQIRVGSNFVKDFPADARVRMDHEAIDQALGGANVFNIVIRADLNDAFVQPDMLSALADLEQWLQAQPEIGSVMSLMDALRQIDVALGGLPGEFQLPDRPSTIKQMFVLGGGPEMHAVVDPRFRGTNLIVRASADDSFALAGLVARIEQRLARLPHPMRADVTGDSVVVAHTLAKIGEGQIISLALSLLAIYLVLMVVFMSVRSAAIALLPNLLPILVYYGALGWFGVPLSPTTSLISCIVLGIAVDDTIHYLTRFNTLARRSGDETAATAMALRDVLRPVTLTTIALVLGFLIMTGSELRNQVQFGALAAFTMAVAWLSDVTFTPALAARLRIVTLWDLLRLDLGARPDEAIPLFHGLNQYQARTFALLAQERNYKAGSVLWRQGDDSDDMYVVIHGRLDVWLERDGQRHLLTTLGRGDVIGEGGFFRQTRSATVTAQLPSRLLQFSAGDLDRITRRRPLLGARVLRNLNQIQAERIARLSHQVAPPA